ncbi:hypothetical protein KP509_28G002400 [Ceratopteris richardii]|uniref:GDSL esterase/lipase n=1 Tax=Ceratopteris richardii TaxID=49495 RepID=A0A8T2R8Z5_CERRI|nr:hypothetical protein KP509_28G002400 [Ceratopteris richardii]
MAHSSSTVCCSPLAASARALYTTTTTQSSNTPATRCSSPFAPVLAFGDSTTDTGNQVQTNTPFATAASPPYGMTFFHRPTGRYSDGRVMLDFLCTALNIDFLPPHLARSSQCANENFAVAGATAKGDAELQSIANVTSLTADTLEVQLSWFKHDLQGHDLSRALVYFGEIGGNDYNYALGAMRPPNEVQALLPAVMDKIHNALHTVLDSCVKKVVVQGQFPMGCIAIYLNLLNNTQPADSNGCISSVMAISNQQNLMLRDVTDSVQRMHPDANIVFFDTTKAYLHILQDPSAYNFRNVRDPCHAGGLELLALANAGNTGAGSSSSALPSPPHVNMTSCPNPENYIGWDGIHLTDAMYGVMMELFLTDARFTSPFPNFLTPCTTH